MIKKINICIFSLLALFALTPTYLSAEFHHVEGCSTCHAPFPYAGPNLKFIKDTIRTPNSGYKDVVFREFNGTNSYADGDASYDGICEVCHTVNNHHRNDGSDGTTHFDGKKCTACHLHVNEFAPPVEQAHRTHLDYRGKGPLIEECTVCHTAPIDLDPTYQFSNDTPQSLVFRDGQPLATTTACDNCHSPWGNYPGGDESTALMEPLLGAKANFRTGIYESDGYTLKPGKEKWCVTCHDDRPSTSQYDADPDNFVPPFEVDYTDPAMTFVGGSWGNRSTQSVPHMRNAGGTPANNEYMTFDFNVSVSGFYRFSTKWAGLADNGTCSTADGKRPLLISVTDANGTTLKSYEHSGQSPDFSEMATFNVVAGPAQLKVQKDNITCTVNIGPIKVDPVAGSGGVVVIAPMIAGDDRTWGFYATGHGVSGVQCTECHDPKKKHIDYDRRTYNMGISKGEVINPWGDSYRLQTKDPISGASLCARCHDMEMIWVRAGAKYGQTNFRRSSNRNQHNVHMGMMDMLTNGGDSDWDGKVDSDPRCTNCHNVHGSTMPHMYRDGNLVSTPYTTDKKPMFPHGYEVYAKATWKPVLQGGSYEVFARWPNVGGAATNAPFTIKSADIASATVRVDQTATPDAWVSLGTYTFNDKNESYVILNDKDTDGTVVADAVRFLSGSEDIIIDNGDAEYGTLGVDANLSGAAGYNGDYDAIAVGTTNSAVSFIDYNNSLLTEQRNFYIVTQPSTGIIYNKICKSCHSGDVSADNVPFTGPKILNRFEKQRWVLNDGTEDAEVYVTARDYDSNISSVTLDLTSLPGGGVVAMDPVGQQLYHYTIPGSMINGLSDISYKLPVTATDSDGQVVTDETYLFPKEGADTIYLDTNDAEVHNVNFTRFAVNTAGQSWQTLPKDITYFGPGYRFSALVGEYNTTYGIWRPEIPTNGKYEVYGFWDDLTGSLIGLDNHVLYSGNVNYTTYAADGTYTVTKDQTAGGGSWNYIGTYSFLAGNSNYVRQAPDGNYTMVFDAMKFVRVNAQPIVRLSAKQKGENTRIVTRSSDIVTVQAIAKDYDAADTIDTLTFDWSGSDAAVLQHATVLGLYGERLDFSPINMPVGVHNVVMTVTDSQGASTTVKLLLQAPQNYPVLGAVDTDGDGINDNVEGFRDLDEDGIPNYLDTSLERHTVAAGTLVITAEAGMDIRIGSTALAADSNDSLITTAELNTSGSGGENGLFDGASNVGGLFDFDVIGLDLVGQSIKVVIPLQGGATIPAGAVYQKYEASTGWRPFTLDTDNAVHSAASVTGVCPDPGDASYITGLNIGHDCIQLTLKDGGANDADGVANGEVKDPGGIFAAPVVEDPPLDPIIPQVPASNPVSDSGSVSYSSGGGGGAMGMWTLLLLSLLGIRSTLARRG